MTILTRNLTQIFLLKLSYKNSCIKFYSFSKWNGSFNFPLKGKTLINKKKFLNILYDEMTSLYLNIIQVS